ncbi:MAG: PAS domain-containing protein, partial [Burkholderia sp.]|nr:PAS domain-containing protein [Burkholderia sp.]
MSRPAAAAREDGEVEALRRRVVALEAEVACLRRGAEQSGPALRAAEILESIDDAFYALDRELRFTYVNRHALAFWGRTAAQLL